MNPSTPPRAPNPITRGSSPSGWASPAKPASSLEVGGGACGEQARHAFRILLRAAGVRAVLINILGGILRCDVLATGVVAAAKDLQVKIPVVGRMEGTNAELGQQILRESGLNFTIANGMKDGAEKVVALAGGARCAYS